MRIATRSALSFSLRFFLLCASLLPLEPARAAELHGRVVGVTDGDTVTVLVGRERVRVRLAEIDAPEKSQPYGARAKQSLSELCYHRDATLATAGRDRYGRTVGVVSCGGVVANREQVRRGLAWVYVRYASRGSALYAVEAEARRQHRGLWEAGDSEPPWQWRRERRGGHRFSAGRSSR